MVTHLLESGSRRRRTVRSTLPSIALHGVIVLAAIHATAHAALPKPSPIAMIDTLVFVASPVTQPSQPHSSRATRPDYPDALRSPSVQGAEVAQFVVDTAGAIEAGSIRILMSDDSLFSAAVWSALRETRFRPAILSGRGVREVVQP